MRHARRETDGRAFHNRQDADGDAGLPFPVFFKKSENSRNLSETTSVFIDDRSENHLQKRKSFDTKGILMKKFLLCFLLFSALLLTSCGGNVTSTWISFACNGNCAQVAALEPAG